MCPVSIGGKAATQAKTCCPTRDHVQKPGSGKSSEYLRDDIGRKFRSREASAHDEAHRNSGIQVAPGDVTDSIGHCQHGEAESQGNTEESDPNLRESGRDHCAATPPENQPECADELSCNT